MTSRDSLHRLVDDLPGVVRDCIIGGRDYAEFAAKVQAILAG